MSLAITERLKALHLPGPMSIPEPRASVMLPTVKCSSCARDIPLSELGDHVCQPLPPSLTPGYAFPSSSSSPPNGDITPRQSRLQPPPQLRFPPQASSSSLSPGRLSPGHGQSTFAPSRSLSQNPRMPPSQQLPPSRGAPSRNISSAPTRPHLSPGPANGMEMTRTRSKSGGSPGRGPAIGLPSQPIPGTRPSFDNQQRPSFDSQLRQRPSFDRRPTADDVRPSLDHPRLTERRPSNDGLSVRSLQPHHLSPNTVQRRPSKDGGSVRSLQTYNNTRTLDVPPATQGPNTNMAGVGRRAFAAAANAVVFANHNSNRLDTQPVDLGQGVPTAVMMSQPRLSTADTRNPAPGWRTSGTRNVSDGDSRSYLGRGRTSSNGHSYGETPPLSPSPSSASTTSLQTPITTTRGPSPQIIEPGSIMGRSRTPSSEGHKDFKSPVFNAPEPVPLPQSRDVRSRAEMKTPSPSPSPPKSTPTPTPPARRRPSLDSEEGSTMLAYGRESLASTVTDEKIIFPSMSASASPPRRPQQSQSSSNSPLRGKGTENGRLTIGGRTAASESVYSRSSIGSASDSPQTQTQPLVPQAQPLRLTPKHPKGELSRSLTLEPLIEHSEPVSPGPRRSHTTPARKGKEVLSCVKCERRIENGRWVRNEGTGVLCEGCWKSLYLPRCRRCDLPIERGAVSSSDGQLKGKWHRDCFTCEECHEPFPSTTFYVHSNNPYCAYHYAALNDSLCAHPRCGQPVEGECAVSHAGDRYHPEHFLCEAPGCEEPLNEYWEVDGRRVCEVHMHAEERDDGDALERLRSMSGGPGGPKTSRAQKRTTRFIDLAGMAAGGR